MTQTPLTDAVREQLEQDRQELGRLREEVRQLKEEAKAHEEFVNECGSLVPEAYDSDESQESCILRFLKDMDAAAGILARLTSAYR